MSNIAIKGNASGTGTFTVEAPNSNTDRTLTLPDDTGTVVYQNTSGNVGIGTTSPSETLSVSAGADGVVARFTGASSSRGLLIKSENGLQASNLNTIDSRSSGSEGILGFATDGTERMRIDPSGDVGIGTTTTEARLNVKQSADNAYQLFLEQNNAADGYGLICDMSDGHLAFSRYASSAYTQRMRLQSNGRMVFQSPSNTGANYQDALIDWRNENNAGVMTRIACYREGSQYAPGALTFHTSNNVDTTSNDSDGNISEKFRIASNGDLTATDTSISSNSDQRLKQNIQDFGYDLETFKQLQTHTFDWKEPHLHGDKSGVRGFVAQELEALDPYWVQEIEVAQTSDDYQYLPDTDILYGENNPYKPEDASATDIERTARFAKTSKLGQKDAMYVSVIQQMLAKIETLEAKVAALEATP